MSEMLALPPQNLLDEKDKVRHYFFSEQTSPFLDSRWFWVSQMLCLFLQSLYELINGELTLEQLQKSCGWSTEMLFERLFDFLAQVDGFRPYDVSRRPQFHIGWRSALEAGELAKHFACRRKELQSEGYTLVLEYNWRSHSLHMGEVVQCNCEDLLEGEEDSDIEIDADIQQMLISHASISSKAYDENDVCYYERDLSHMMTQSKPFTLLCRATCEEFSRTVCWDDSLGPIMLSWSCYPSSPSTLALSLPMVIDRNNIGQEAWQVFTSVKVKHGEVLPSVLLHVPMDKLLPLAPFYLSARLRMTLPSWVTTGKKKVYEVDVPAGLCQDPDLACKLLLPSDGWPKMKDDSFHLFDQELFRLGALSCADVLQCARETFSGRMNLAYLLSKGYRRESHVSIRLGDWFFTLDDNGIHFSSVKVNLQSGEGEFRSGLSGLSGQTGTADGKSNVIVGFDKTGQLLVKASPLSRFTAQGEWIVWKGAFVTEDKEGSDPAETDRQLMERDAKNKEDESYYRAKKEGLRPCIVTLGLDGKSHLIAPNADLSSGTPDLLHIHKFRANGARVLSISELKLLKCAQEDCDRCAFFPKRNSTYRYCSLHWHSSDSTDEKNDEADDDEHCDHETVSLLQKKDNSFPSLVQMTELPSHFQMDRMDRMDQMDREKKGDTDENAEQMTAELPFPSSQAREKKGEADDANEKKDEEAWVLEQILLGSLPAQSARPPLYHGRPGFRYKVGETVSELDFNPQLSRCHLPGIYFLMNPEDVPDLVFADCVLKRQFYGKEAKTGVQQANVEEPTGARRRWRQPRNRQEARERKEKPLSSRGVDYCRVC